MNSYGQFVLVSISLLPSLSPSEDENDDTGSVVGNPNDSNRVLIQVAILIFILKELEPRSHIVEIVGYRYSGFANPDCDRLVHYTTCTLR